MIKKYYLYLSTALLIYLFFLFKEPFNGLSRDGMTLIGIFLATLLLWMTISIDWPSLLLLAMLGTLSSLDFKTILSSSFGNNTITFLIFTFALTYALSKTPFIKKIAHFFINSNFAKRGEWSFIFFYSFAILLSGLFISPTVLFFIYMPIMEEIANTLQIKKGSKAGAILMMLTVINVGISSAMTPIAHVFPVLAMKAYQEYSGIMINYITYSLIAIPIGILVSGLTILAFYFIYKPDLNELKNLKDKNIKLDLQENKSDKITIIVFIIVILLWILPSLFNLLLPASDLNTFFKMIDSLSVAFPPLLGIIILSIIKIQNKSILSLSEAFSKGVSWPSIIMCIGTIALGSALTNNDIGLTKYLSDTLAPILTSLPNILVILLFVSWAAIQTNLSSNMVTATLVSSSAIALASALNEINMQALIILIGMMSAYAFATPPAMPCVAIAGSSGYTNPKEMAIWGFVAMIIAIIVFTFIAYPLACLLI